MKDGLKNKCYEIVRQIVDYSLEDLEVWYCNSKGELLDLGVTICEEL